MPPVDTMKVGTVRAAVPREEDTSKAVQRKQEDRSKTEVTQKKEVGTVLVEELLACTGRAVPKREEDMWRAGIAADIESGWAARQWMADTGRAER
jgi:hypothetical protein